MEIFFKDMAIGLTLTVMLVMYTMYHSIIAAVPKTAYIKYVDVWIGCCLMLPFLVFFIQVKIIFKKSFFVTAIFSKRIFPESLKFDLT